MSSCEVLRIALWAAIEEYGGVWEVPWELRGANILGSDQDAMTEAGRAVHVMLDRGWIVLYRAWEPDGEMVEVPPEMVAGVLEEESTWTPPEWDGTSVRMVPTAEGERAYRHLRNSSDDELPL